MDSDTQASFSLSVRIRLRQQYSDRCVICLLVIPDTGSLGCTQCAHLLDADQVTTAQSFGILANDFEANSVGNGFLQCPLCRVAFFTPNHVALSPPVPVLRYIHEYLRTAVNRLPLCEVLQLLRNAKKGVQVDLPQDPTPVLPYLDLFSLVVLNPADVAGLRIPTLCYPPKYSIQNGEFRLARNRSTPSTTTARIFDAVGAGNNTPPDSYGYIPLSPEDPEFNTQRYWRLPIKTEVILAILINRIAFFPPSPEQRPEIKFARWINALLRLSDADVAHGGGRGGRGGGSNIGNTAAGLSKPRERGKKKRRTGKRGASKEDPGLGLFREKIDKRGKGQSLVSSCERPHFGVDPKEWIVITTLSSTLDDREPHPKAYSGYFPLSNRESECDEDNPKRWKFGPSFTTDRIIAEARQMMKL